MVRIAESQSFDEIPPTNWFSVVFLAFQCLYRALAGWLGVVRGIGLGGSNTKIKTLQGSFQNARPGKPCDCEEHSYSNVIVF